MCILCAVQRWSRRVATMLPWLVLPLILLWALSQLLPAAYRFEVTSPRLACVSVLLLTLFWYEILLPRLSVWRARRSARLREERRAHALELQKLRKTATRRCRNCNNPYRDQNPGGGKFMCSYCGHVSKRPVLDLGSAGKVPSGWPCSQDWANAAGDPGYWLDLRCSTDNSYSGFSWRLFSCFYVSMAWFWRKVLRFGSSGDGGGLGRDGKMLTKGGENGGKAEESRVDKAKRKAEEKRLARLEREMLEEEERKQREEMAKLVEERRRLRDEKAEAEERSKGATPVGEKDARKEAERRRQERRRKEDKGSSKSNSDCEDIERRVSREGEWKRDFDRRNEPDRRDATRVGTEGYKPHNFEASSQGGKTVQSRTKYFGRMTGGLLSSSRGFSGGSIFGRSAQTPAPQANKVTKPLVTATDQVVQRFQELFSQPKYKEAAELAVEFPQDLLRTPETIAKFKSAPLQLGQESPLLQYFATLLAQGKLNAYESLELSRLAINQNGKNLLEGWLADDKLECSEELGNLVKTVDDDLALKIFIRARDNPRVVAAFNERAEFDNIIIHTKQRENASALKGPGEINYKVYDGEGSIFSSNFNSGPSSEMADLASEIEALERILSDASAQPTKLSYALIKSVTNNFSKVIGRGGFAVVYQGFLQNGKIAVKKLSLSNGFSDELFVDEIECLTKAKHNNVVRYLGYCADTQGELMEFNGRCVIAEVPKRLLCFEFVPNGSLHRYLKAKPCGDEWQVRYKIIKGICQGLQYLHKIRINHLDLKPGNILLDVGMEPKIADFGLSRCFDEEQSRVFTKHIYGTRGYIAPEIINSGEISFKSDIFALGIIIIKLLTGHNDYDIENWHKSLNADCPQVRRCIEIAQACVDDDQHKRPAISEIIHKLDELETIVDSPAIN